MKMAKVLIGGLAAAILFLNLGCTINLAPATPTVGYVKFVNAVAYIIPGDTVHYYVRNLSGLDQTWSAEIAYGSQSIVKEVTPFSGTFSIAGEIQSELSASGTWVGGSWEFTKTIEAGDTAILKLTMP
jgi:hypothetical protein